MAIEFETVFIAVRVHNVDLGILKIDCVFIKRMTVHAATDFVLKIFG